MTRELLISLKLSSNLENRLKLFSDMIYQPRLMLLYEVIIDFVNTFAFYVASYFKP